MEKEQYLVSICIPTYNRAPYLKKCLDSLVCQPEFQQGLVEIVVSDNASTDNTEKVAGAYSTAYPNFHYYKNETNIGFKNLGIVVARGTGALRKLSNDTIVYKKHSLQIFCAAVQTYRQSMPILLWSNGETKRRLYTDDVNEFFREISFYSTWSGAFSLWDEDCKGIMKEALASTSEMWHLECLCRLLLKKRKLVICPDAFGKVQSVSRKNISYGLYKVFYENYLGLLSRLVEKKVISESCLADLKKDLLYRFFKFWIIQWELQNADFQFSEKENLKKLVFAQYEKEDYFLDFLKAYQKDYTLTKRKNFIKKIPVLGAAAVCAKRAFSVFRQISK